MNAPLHLPRRQALHTLTAGMGGLDVQLVYYRGFGEFRATDWLSNSGALVTPMSAVRCMAGKTQIARVLRHAVEEAKRGRVNAVVYVGDALEEEPDALGALAGELGVRGIPVFVFQEGRDAGVESIYRQIARLSGGAWCRFDSSSADQLRDLLGAVAAYAAGGRKALADYGTHRGDAVLQLTRQMGGG